MSKISLNDEIDALFMLPLADFTAARNDLASRLKKEKRADDSSVVKALAKPSVTAWAVNQLHWNHRKEFDQLLQGSERFRRAQASRGADIRETLEARREALAHLSHLAASLLTDAGHNPTPDTIQRITTTLEAISAYASPSDGAVPGRLTRDLDPPGFDSLVSLMGGAVPAKAREELPPPSHSKQPASAAVETRKKVSSGEDVQKARELEDARQAKIAAARASVRDAERSLEETETRAEGLEAARKKAHEDAARAESELHEAEEHLRAARAASHEAAEGSKRAAAEAREATRAVDDARRNLEEASRHLQSLLGE
ncbi:MAG TPA: hypothetical protein VI756_10280 [Blastocatellia bacterium]